MDGYTLMAKMRKARRRFRLTATEQALFTELVEVCNCEGWTDVFDCSNVELCTALLINEKTLIKARNSLINAGLIYYKSGKSKRLVSSYSFLREFKTAVKNTADPTGDRTVDRTGESQANGTDFIKLKTETGKEENEIKEAFEKFRKIYPGSKRGMDTEFENFRKRHRDYQETVFLLFPATEKLIAWHRAKEEAGEFVPQYPMLQTWVNQRRWEEELEEIKSNQYAGNPSIQRKPDSHRKYGGY